ncbi:MAG: hypothetical protein JHC31_01460 [Sulfurihydrogenibium sp.]|jgi:hypothetical protein|nr:hypothetical protein [Sulfurihydrogenibium sp.]
MSKQKLTVIVSNSEMPLLYDEISKANNMAERIKVLAMLGLIYEKNLGNGIVYKPEVVIEKKQEKDVNEKIKEENDDFLLSMMGNF